MNTGRLLDDKSNELQIEINRLSEKLGVHPMRVGLRTNDGLNIYTAYDGSYHFTFYERGKLVFDRSGSLDDLLYWYCESVVTRQAAKWVGDRAERFKYEYQVLVNSTLAGRKGGCVNSPLFSVMASRRTFPCFPTLAKRYNTRPRGIFARAAALVLSAESLRRWPNPATHSDPNPHLYPRRVAA